jgi:site-specific DNA recombinase
LSSVQPGTDRDAWVSYLRVSTPEQADSELSLLAQRRSTEAYARQHDRTVVREYVEAGCSGTTMNRKAFRAMLQDVLRTDSDVGTILVHHTSRFSRDATEARVLKKTLRKKGVRVISVCQHMDDGPFGNLVEGMFECIDEYESQIIGARSSEAMYEAARQGYYCGSKTPYGFTKAKVDAGRGVIRSILVPDEHEAPVVQLVFELYTVLGGALMVATELTQRGIRYRKGKPWTKDLVLAVLDEPASSGMLYWQKRDPLTGKRRHPSECLPLRVEPIVDIDLYDRARSLRDGRAPERLPGRAPSPTTLLWRLVHCAKCGGTYRLESSGKGAPEGKKAYRYYNCSTYTRQGKQACAGHRIRTENLDAAVLEHIASVVCTDARAAALRTELQRRAASHVGHPGTRSSLRDALDEVRAQIADWSAVAAQSQGHRDLAKRRLSEMRAHVDELEVEIDAAAKATADADGLDGITVVELRQAWAKVVLAGGVVSRSYLHRLVERIEVDENQIRIIQRQTDEMAAGN